MKAQDSQTLKRVHPEQQVEVVVYVKNQRK